MRKSFCAVKNFFLQHGRNTGSGVFKVPLESIEILKDPLDFYAALYTGMKQAQFRAVFSSLYWGIGEMEDYLITALERNVEKNENLRIKVIMDSARGQRLSKPGSRFLNSYEMVNRLKTNHPNRDVQVSLWRNSKPTLMGSAFRYQQLAEALGVHHVKLAIFDNSIILTGANFEEQYFLNRQDRYWLINNAQAFADHLEDFIDSLMTVSDRTTILNNTQSPFGYKGAIMWEKRAEAIDSQNRVHNYLSSQAALQRSSTGEVGVIESVPIPRIEDKRGDKKSGGEEAKNELQIQGREVTKQNIMELIKEKEISQVMSQLRFDKDIFNPEHDKLSGNCMYFFAAPQNKIFNIDNESHFLGEMLDSLSKVKDLPELEQIYFSSAYLNPPHSVFDGLLDLPSKDYTFITAAKEVPYPVT